jgi:hypothetical protein
MQLQPFAGAAMTGPAPEYVVLDRPVRTTSSWYDSAFGTKRPVHHTKDIQVRVDAGIQNQLPAGYDPYGIHRIKQLDSEIAQPSAAAVPEAEPISEEKKEKEKIARLQRFAHRGLSSAGRSTAESISLRQPREVSPRRPSSGAIEISETERQFGSFTSPGQSFSGLSIPNAKDLYPDSRTRSELWREEEKKEILEEKTYTQEAPTAYVTPYDATLSPSIDELIQMRKAGDTLERIPSLSLQVKDKIFINWENADLSMISDIDLKPLERKLKQGLRFLPGKVFEFNPPPPLCDLATDLSVYVGEDADENALKKVCAESGTEFVALSGGFWNFKTGTRLPL